MSSDSKEPAESKSPPSIETLRRDAFGNEGNSSFDKREFVNLRSTREGEVFYRIEAVERQSTRPSNLWVVPEKQWNEWKESGDFEKIESSLCLPMDSRSESGRYHVSRITAGEGCRLAEGQVGPAAEKNIIHGNFRPTQQAVLVDPEAEQSQKSERDDNRDIESPWELTGSSRELKIDHVATLDVKANRLDPPEARLGTRTPEDSRHLDKSERFRGATDARDNRHNANDNHPSHDMER